MSRSSQRHERLPLRFPESNNLQVSRIDGYNRDIGSLRRQLLVRMEGFCAVRWARALTKSRLEMHAWMRWASNIADRMGRDPIPREEI